MERIYTDFFIVIAIDIDIVIVIEKDRNTDFTDLTDFYFSFWNLIF